MLTTIRSNLIARLRGFHQDEAGDTMQAIAVGAVGVLLASVLFSTISSVITGGGSGGGGGGGGGGGLSGLFGSFINGLASGVGSLIKF
jgi:hypothetical protein